jgi:hypothetical protein
LLQGTGSNFGPKITVSLGLKIKLPSRNPIQRGLKLLTEDHFVRE